MMNKSSLTSEHIVKIDINKIVKYLSQHALDILKDELHSDDLSGIEVGTTLSDGSIYFINKFDY